MVMGKGKPAGQPIQKPTLMSDMASGLKEVAGKVTADDSEEARRAAAYIYKLALYLESDFYKERRKLLNERVQAAKMKKDPLRGTRKRGKKSITRSD